MSVRPRLHPANAGLGLPLLLAGCAGPHHALDPAGPPARHIAGLWWVLFWVALAVLLGVVTALLVAVVRGATARAHSPREPGVVVTMTERGTVAAVTAAVGLTALIVLSLLTASVLVGRTLAGLRAPDALSVEVVGHRWWWEIRYPGSSPSEQVTTANELHVPVGRPVKVRTISHDVIHSLWVPSLHGKRDLVPGHPGEIVLQADRPGVFNGQCAEYCGLEHALMRLLVIAEPADRFDTWLTAQRETPPPPADAETRRGHDVFLAQQCPLCHTIQGTPAGGRVGPDLTHVGSRQTIAAGVLPNAPEHLAMWMLDPQSVKPGTLMPASAIMGDDMASLVLYLGSLR